MALTKWTPTTDLMMLRRMGKLQEEPEIDPAVPYELKWVVCAVDRSRYDQQISKEKEVVSAMLKGERRAAKEKALAALMELVPNVGELRLLLNGGAK